MTGRRRIVLWLIVRGIDYWRIVDNDNGGDARRARDHAVGPPAVEDRAVAVAVDVLCGLASEIRVGIPTCQPRKPLSPRLAVLGPLVGIEQTLK
jgi:hypothetical protein